jgi:hypothetical protein
MMDLAIMAALVIVILLVAVRNYQYEGEDHADGTPGCDPWCDCQMRSKWKDVETDTTWDPVDPDEIFRDGR